jgi:hypothetical protein
MLFRPGERRQSETSAITMRPGWLAQAAFVFSPPPFSIVREFSRRIPHFHALLVNELGLHRAIPVSKCSARPTCYTPDSAVSSVPPVVKVVKNVGSSIAPAHPRWTRRPADVYYLVPPPPPPGLLES